MPPSPRGPLVKPRGMVSTELDPPPPPSPPPPPEVGPTTNWERAGSFSSDSGPSRAYRLDTNPLSHPPPLPVTSRHSRPSSPSLHRSSVSNSVASSSRCSGSQFLANKLDPTRRVATPPPPPDLTSFICSCIHAKGSSAAKISSRQSMRPLVASPPSSPSPLSLPPSSLSPSSFSSTPSSSSLPSSPSSPSSPSPPPSSFSPSPSSSSSSSS
mmetsp:Transcript_68617/g.128786  ORF Transcript_68617/g.128786 Transcript_68617/m.128786 type:complete len:212 (-) Transcript_68617:64-699(-)